MGRLEWCQVITLLLSIAIVAGLGTNNFIRANENVARQYKPERKLYAIEYDVEDPDSNYQMPSVILSVWFTIARYPYYFEDFKSGIDVCTRDGGSCRSVEFNTEVLAAHATLGFGTDNEIYSECSWTFNISSNETFNEIDFLHVTDWMLDDKLAWIRVGVFRSDVTPATSKDISDLLYLRVVEEHCLFEVEYTETVKHKYDGSIKSDISTLVFDQFCTDLHGVRTVLLRFRSDFEVEHWEEYIDYGYVDWFVGMGGLVTFMTSVFLVVAGQIMKIGENKSTGILRLVSGFHNLKEIVWDLSAKRSIPDSNL